MESVPSYIEALQRAEHRLSGLLEGICTITLHTELSDDFAEAIKSVDNQKFRQELRYSIEEIKERAAKPGFKAFLASLDGVMIAFDFGYSDREPGVFFSDTTATLIEGKKIGSTLFALEIIYNEENEYWATMLATEEYDEKNRPLESIWGKLGFRTVRKREDGNILMRLDHSPKALRYLYEKYIL